MTERKYAGIPVSGGIGLGRAYVVKDDEFLFAEYCEDTEREIRRFDEAAKKFSERCETLALRAEENGADGNIMRGHSAMLGDVLVMSEIREKIASGRTSESALTEVLDSFERSIASSGDELLAARAADVKDVKREMLRLLSGKEDRGLSGLPENSVLVMSELTPTMTATMDRANVAAIITEKGGVTSHSAIIARALGIPSVSGLSLSVENGEEMIVDGTEGTAIMSPTNAEKEKCREKMSALERTANAEKEFAHKESVTRDGVKKRICANVGSHTETDSVNKNGADGIGLFRTELLFLDRESLPDEEEQYESYKTIAENVRGEVYIRTLDVGGDKNVPGLGLKKEENPFLGYRGIRYCLGHRELFRTQLRAILRASAYGKIGITLPLITRADEVDEAKELIEEAKNELGRENVPFDDGVHLGVMIETPASCAIADVLARKVDYFSIGTNDLTGYVMACDRGNADVSYLYSPYDPAILRMIKHAS
ncbi:MAG: phosphoenolpyruvate--protein phosphotransferase, partial [Clostridia bacterium]|nr:phosphoenolpyruvate--protein phosphotransferase [Clostridia bacterium]